MYKVYFLLLVFYIIVGFVKNGCVIFLCCLKFWIVSGCFEDYVVYIYGMVDSCLVCRLVC